MRFAFSLPVVMYLAVIAACGHPPIATAPVAAGAPPAELRVPAFDEQRSNPRFLADRIYIVGRSDTRIAYVIEPADEACGCYMPEIIVLDPQTGAVFWKDTYDSGELDPANTSQLKNLDQLWRARGADWERHVSEHGIPREAAVPPVQAIPTGGPSLPRIEIHTDSVGAESPEGYEHLTTYRIDLVSSRGTKQIATSMKPASEYNLLAVETPGYVALEGTRRVAVLVLETRRGWEGSPRVSRLRFVGAELNDAER